jgi:ketosteroid isomerase-like protein
MKILTAIIIITGLTSCQKQSLSIEEMKRIVTERNKRLTYLFIKGNADSLALIYTSEAKLSLNGYDFANGRNSIHQLWQEDMVNSKVLEMTNQTLKIDGNSDVIYETGKTRLKLTFKDSIFNTTVKYCNIWRKQDNGEYLLDVDFSNADKK